jgi:hypothetical protein
MLCFVGLGQAAEEDRARAGLAGPVREATIADSETVTTYLFDRDGRFLQTVRKTMPPVDQPEVGEQVQKLVYSYDEQGRVIRELIEEDGQQYVSRLVDYDRAGRMTADAAYHMCGTFSSLKVFRYDPTDRIEEILIFQFRSLVRQTFQYDQDGKVAVRKNSKNGQLRTTTVFRYDVQGRMSEEAELLTDGTPLYTLRLAYDRNGNRTAEEFVDHTDPWRNSKAELTYEYEPRGNLTKRTIRRGSSIEVTERSIAYY